MQNIFSQWLFSLKHYLLMCLLLSGPDRLPYSPYPVVLTGFVYFLLGLLLVDAKHSYLLICTLISVELAMLGGIAWLGLLRNQALPRFRQTFSALLGVNVVMTVVGIIAHRFNDASTGDNVLLYTTVALVAWSIVILSRIFKSSLDLSTHLSAMLSFCYFIAYHVTVYWLIS